jgi:hypothetical protein
MTYDPNITGIVQLPTIGPFPQQGTPAISNVKSIAVSWPGAVGQNNLQLNNFSSGG